jgi:Holliday junction DNA helicase RuvB
MPEPNEGADGMTREPTIKGRARTAPPPAGPAAGAAAADPVDDKLRPQRLCEIIGQRAVAERLAVSLAAARKRNEPLPHILFDGPPGLGKTTFATVLHNELGVELSITSGAALDKKMDVMPFLTNASEGSILFIDEIHRLPRAVEEFIYPVMEDFRVDVVLGEGMSARTLNLPLKKFTIIGATTRSGMLSGPLRERFGMHEHLEFYDVPDLAKIITINAAKQVEDRRRRGLGARRPQPRDSSNRQRPAAMGARFCPGSRRRTDQPDDCTGCAGDAGSRLGGAR